MRLLLVFFDLLGYGARIDRFGAVNDTFRSTINGLYADIIRLGTQQGEFHVRDEEEASAVVRAIIDGLFAQWLQEKDWQASYVRYRATCKQAILAYLHCADGLDASNDAA